MILIKILLPLINLIFNVDTSLIDIKISLDKKDISKTDTTIIVNVELINNSNSIYFLWLPNMVYTDFNSDYNFWNVDLRFNDTVKVYKSRGLVNIRIPSKKEYIKIKPKGNFKFSFEIPFFSLNTFDERMKSINDKKQFDEEFLSKQSLKRFGLYSLVLTYSDRHMVNKTNQHYFESNELLFNFNKN